MTPSELFLEWLLDLQTDSNVACEHVGDTITVIDYTTQNRFVLNVKSREKIS